MSKQGGEMLNINGIPCGLRTPRMRRAVREVLKRIRVRCPRDYERLRSLVRGIHPLSAAEEDERGTLGRWEEFHPVREDRTTWNYGYGDTPGIVYLSEREYGQDPLGIVAHEFGHACVREEDLERRGECWSDEWTEELAAAWYAYKWGFGRIIARDRESMDWGHHGVAPGATFVLEEQGEDLWYRVSRRFVVHRTPGPAETLAAKLKRSRGRPKEK